MSRTLLYPPTRRTALLGGLSLGALGAPLGVIAAGAEPPATLYSGGDILTMEGDAPRYAEALVEAGGQIVFVGRMSEAVHRFPAANRFDLHGQTLLPGFIDGHSHIYMTGFMALMANLYPPPDGPARDFASLVSTLRQWTETSDGRKVIQALGWIIGSGYDDALLAERRHPPRQVLDEVSRDLPVLVIHQSGHLASINSKGLEVAGITRATPDPKGGVIRRDANGEPNGVLEESAYMRLALKATSSVGEEIPRLSMQRAQRLYAQSGYTTAQDGRSTRDVTDVLPRMAERGELYLDVVSYPDITFNAAAAPPAALAQDRRYHGHYRVGGAKLALDGSPQGKTAWLSAPYVDPPEGQSPGYLGYPAMSDEAAVKWVGTAFSNRWQLLVHANGDAAIDQLIMAVAAAQREHGYPDHRTVLVHGQTLRKDQIAKLKTLGILPSLFPLHTYYWGDWHRSSVLGASRANYISPTRDVLRAGLTLTSHHDAPVTLPDALRVLDGTVNRTTRSGQVLGADQRLTPYEGLKTLTAWAALQYFEEGRKGTLAVGKVADLVILGENPLKVRPERIHQIAVNRTIKEGKTVFSR